MVTGNREAAVTTGRMALRRVPSWCICIVQLTADLCWKAGQWAVPEALETPVRFGELIVLGIPGLEGDLEVTIFGHSVDFGSLSAHLHEIVERVTFAGFFRAEEFVFQSIEELLEKEMRLHLRCTFQFSNTLRIDP